MKKFFALCIATFICAVLSPIGTWVVEPETTKSAGATATVATGDQSALFQNKNSQGRKPSESATGECG